MSAYSQQPTKRQKVREPKDGDYFQGIDKIEYNNMAAPTDATTYRYYSGSERVHNRTVDDWIKFSVSFTEFRNDGTLPQDSSHSRPWDDHTDSTENYKRCIKTFFEFCNKLGVKYWTAFDSDFLPWSDRSQARCDDMCQYIHQLAQKHHTKLLWIAPDLHSHTRYNYGAFTSNDASTFIQAASQIKQCLDLAQRLNAESFLLWPYREGYDTIFQTDVAKEIKLFAKLLKITGEYKDRLNFRCQLLIMPYYYHFGRNCSIWQHSWRQRDMINMYMWDVTSCLYFLKNYNLDRYYKVVTPPGHHMYLANVYNMLGGVVITSEFDQYNIKKLTLMMKCIIDQGTAPPAGVHLSLRVRARHVRHLVVGHVQYVDAVARGLRHAGRIVADQLVDKHLQQRYASYHSGFGSRLVTHDISIEECDEYHKKNVMQDNEMTSSKTEHLDLMFQRYLDTSDHI